MTENKRYKVAIYDEKAISGYCVLDLENPSRTARLKYKNVYISTEYGCNIVCDLLNEQDIEIKRLKDELFEARKDYIVDTADISDKPYLDEMIEEERKEIYGDDVE